MSELDERVRSWSVERPTLTGQLDDDARRLSIWLENADSLTSALRRPPVDTRVRAAWHAQLRRGLEPFIRRYVLELVRDARTLDISELLHLVEQRFPFLVPSVEALAFDAERPLREKLGIEYKWAILLSVVLDDLDAGTALCEGSRRATVTAQGCLSKFRATDRLELRGASIRRVGKVAYVELVAPNTLNAEDECVLDALEVCVDLALLDDRVEVGVLRGGVVHKASYAGRRVFCSGINLSALYSGKLNYLFYVRRELGLVSKLYRGLAADAELPAIEKPWVAVVDRHAIGGGCQLLLVMDYVIAESDAVLTLPAGREGIMPGAANLRMARFVGELAARGAVLMEQRIRVEDELGRRIVDEVVARERIDDRITHVVQTLLSAGSVSVTANRKALRLAHEPLTAFREYMAHFALGQADCHFSAALAENLERHWLQRRDRTA